MILQRWFSALMAVAIFLVTTVSPAHAASDLTWNDIRGGGGMMSVSMIDVGQGNCVVIGCPSGIKIAADCGTSNKIDDFKEKVRRYAKEFLGPSVPDNIEFFQSVIISHSDKDHHSLIPVIVPKDPTEDDMADLNYVEYVYLPASQSSPNDYDSPQDSYSWIKKAGEYELLKKLNAEQTSKPVEPIKSLGLSCTDNSGDSDSGVYILAVNLGADASYGSNANSQSIVTFLRYAAKSDGEPYKPFTVMLPGDIEKVASEYILARKYKNKQFSDPTSEFLSTDVMMASHHGAEEGINADREFLRTTHPQVTVFSSGQEKSYYHPRCSAVEEAATYALKNIDTHELTTGKVPNEGATPNKKPRVDSPSTSTSTSATGLQYVTNPRAKQALFGTMDSGTVISLSDGKGKFSVYTCKFPDVPTSADNWADEFTRGCEKMVDNADTL